MHIRVDIEILLLMLFCYSTPRDFYESPKISKVDTDHLRLMDIADIFFATVYLRSFDSTSTVLIWPNNKSCVSKITIFE